jgi:hypothetical protein
MGGTALLRVVAERSLRSITHSNAQKSRGSCFRALWFINVTVSIPRSLLTLI